MGLALAGLSFCVPAFAQTPCQPRKEVIAKLYQKYDEVRNARGVMIDGSSIVEIFSAQSGDDRTFTIVVTYPNGLSCIRAAGTDFYYEHDAPSI